jgi:hypothetical protein
MKSIPGFTAEESLESPQEHYGSRALNNSPQAPGHGSQARDGVVQPAAACYDIPVFYCEPGLEGGCSLGWRTWCV